MQRQNLNNKLNRLYISKTQYCWLWQCPKRAWLQKYKPELAEEDAGAKSRMAAGRMVGEIAKGLFDSYVDVTVRKGDFLDIPAMKAATMQEISRNTPVICEACFSHYRLFCAVDILRKTSDGWAIYEVKSSTEAKKDVYIADVAYQLYVLEHCGINVTSVNIIVLNRDYVLDGKLDIERLFKITDVTIEARAAQGSVEEDLCLAADIFAMEIEPDIQLSKACRSPYPCPFQKYCLSELSALERENHQPDYTDHDSLRRFLHQLWFPLYFLDMETIQPVIPKFQGTRPYDQIPFQYSLHYYDYADGELKHKEFLAEPGTDPRRALAESLCQDIPSWACVVAYNKTFECTRIKELAAQFPDLSNQLQAIEKHIIDLLVPFRNGWLYRQAMGDSCSIKSVLPALYPNDPELDYHHLDQIHNGNEAMQAFPAMEAMTPKQREETRKNLLEYCKLDTLAIVKIWEKLNKIA